jgi:putative ABC transport system substrate-binding protein
MKPLRRKVVALVLGAPALVRAQATRLRKIGFLVPSPGYPDRWEALTAGLREIGWMEGRNLAIEWRHAEEKYDRMAGLTRELVQAGAEIIVTNSTPGVLQARKATSTVPIVSAAFGDPVASGLVTNLARPGGNVTGISIFFDDMAPKLLELASASMPKLTRAAVLHNSGNPQAVAEAQKVNAFAVKQGLTALLLGARTPAEVDAAFAEALRERCEALLALGDPLMIGQRPRIAEFGLKHRLPTFGQSAEFVESGCLASYGPDFRASFRRAAYYIDRILKGTKPGDIPIEQTTALELVLNRKTADAIGLALPRGLLLRASRIIE